MEKKSYPTPRGPAANKAKQKYNKEHYSRISVNVSKDYHYYLKLLANESGQSLNSWVLKAIEDRAENRYNESSSQDYARLIEWMRKNGHPDSEIVDLLYYTCSGENLKNIQT